MGLQPLPLLHTHSGRLQRPSPLGLAPRLASAQGYVHHASFWVDVLGLMAHSKRRDVRSQVLSEIAEINKAGSAASSAVNNGVMDPSQLRKGHPDTNQYMDSTEAAAANRYDSTKGWERSLATPDEYPFTATAQGGKTSHLNGVSVATQRSQGGQFKSFLTTNNVKRGDWFQINPILN